MPVTINGTTGISGVDGSAGTPAVIGSDADTGFAFAAGQITASLNGAGANVPLVQGTAQNSTSGSNIDFTGIPSWAKRITVALNGVSTSGTAQVQIQLGTSGGIDATGYTGATDSSSSAGAVAAASFTTGLGLERTGVAAAASARSGIATFVNVTGNTWVGNWVGARTDSACILWGSTTKTLSGVLDRVRITANGTDTFDAGSINILYE